MVLQLEVAGQIVYLLILIVMLFFALRKCKRNGGRGHQITSILVNAGAGDDEGDSSSDQISMGPTSLGVNASTTMAC